MRYRFRTNLTGLFLLGSLLCGLTPAFALETTTEILKTALTYHFFKFIEWPEEENLKTFRIGLIGVGEKLASEMKDAATHVKVRGRTFEVIHYRTVADVDPKDIQLLYVGEREARNLPQIANKIRRTGTLLVTDESDAKRDLMINLYQAADSTIKFQINRPNIVFERLKMDKKIVILGGTELDVAELFRASEYSLQQIKEELVAKENQLTKLSADIVSQRQELQDNQKYLLEQKTLVEIQKQKLDKHQQVLNEKETLISDKTAELSAVTGALAKASTDLAQKSEALQKSQKELEKSKGLLNAGKQQLAINAEQLNKSQEQLATNLTLLHQSEIRILALTGQIAESQKTLDEQLKKLAQQNVIIGYQRAGIVAVTLVALFILTLAIITFQINRARKKALLNLDAANQELKTIHDKLERDKQEADRANQEKSRFLANMSHEIRTPMNVILGYSELMQQASGLSADSKRNLEVINRSGEHLLTLINDVLDISKIESGNVTLVSEHFCLQSLLTDLEVMFSARCKHQGLQFHMECSQGQPVYLFADQGKIRQIMINLIGNAIKFTKEGSVHVRVKIIPASENLMHLIAEIEDSGVGIADADFSKVFKLYGQTESGIHSGKGTGLGLAISREYSHRMGGEITFSSVVGVGSLFRLELPCELGEEVHAPKEEFATRPIGLKSGQSPCRILLVDDIDSNRDLLDRILTPLGFVLKEACSGEEAVDACDAWRPNLVLMDLQMPGMGGREAIRLIRTKYDKNALPIIVVSASAFESERRQVIDIGANDYIRKPFKAREIISKVGEWLGLEFVYAEELSATTQPDSSLTMEEMAAALQRLPPELKDKLRQAVDIGHSTQILRLLDEIALLEHGLASALKHLAQDFKYDALSEILSE